jgi:hypothetical protein
VEMGKSKKVAERKKAAARLDQREEPPSEPLVPRVPPSSVGSTVQIRGLKSEPIYLRHAIIRTFSAKDPTCAVLLLLPGCQDFDEDVGTIQIKVLNLTVVCSYCFGPAPGSRCSKCKVL